MQNMCFGPRRSISGYRSCENCFRPNASILLHCKKNDDLDCFEQFKNLHIVKDSKICFGSECTISEYWCFRTKCMHSTLLDKKWWFGLFLSVSKTFVMWKDRKLAFWAWMHYFGVPKLRKSFPPNAFILIPRTNNDVCECLEHFGILRNVNWCETYVLGLNALFLGTEVVKMILQQINPFNSIWPKIMFGSVLEHFVNLPHVKRCKTCVSVLNAVFWGTEVVRMVSHHMHPFHSIAQKMMVWIVFV
jgi:hypothetical protein